ncbi:hypothetical protein KL86DYS1_30538 [uncultured Dysgonomonas sp.]|uniref:Transposase n=1 Tax=uncultured Dysgonomonas sp. TaxID=206096 RepID=A0A212JV13_9BACT|nr:hypothetical protein KL86DYS1_30538 [uncultured Dysgonomonas sp.]
MCYEPDKVWSNVTGYYGIRRSSVYAKKNTENNILLYLFFS